MTRGLPWILGLIALACRPDPDRQIVYSEDFEGCGAGACGVTTVRGAAAFVSTWHAGEHALELRDDAVVQLGMTLDPVSGDDVDVDAVVLCPAGSEVVVRTTIDGEAREVRFGPCCARRFHRQDGSFGPLAGDGLPAPEVELIGPGPCIIDDLVLTTSVPPFQGCV